MARNAARLLLVLLRDRDRVVRKARGLDLLQAAEHVSRERFADRGAIRGQRSATDTGDGGAVADCAPNAAELPSLCSQRAWPPLRDWMNGNFHIIGNLETMHD